MLPPDGFRHEALLYAGDEQFVGRCASFVRTGLELGEPTLVVALARKLDLLREELGPDAAHVCFADMAVVGHNPARIIPAWHRFVERNHAPGIRLRGIGEPVFPERDPQVLVECERHEALLNLAFTGSERFWLLCPYDVEALPPAVVAEARRNHPFVESGGRHEASLDFHGLDSIPGSLDERLPEPRGRVAELEFDRGTLAAVRRFVAREGAAAGLSRNRSRDLVVAANEIASNSVKHGGGEGTLRMWAEPGRLLCDIRDCGGLRDPLSDRRLPGSEAMGGRGLWLANQLCDLVQVRSAPAGTVVRLHIVRE